MTRLPHAHRQCATPLPQSARYRLRLLSMAAFLAALLLVPLALIWLLGAGAVR